MSREKLGWTKRKHIRTLSRTFSKKKSKKRSLRSKTRLKIVGRRNRSASRLSVVRIFSAPFILATLARLKLRNSAVRTRKKLHKTS